jgi:hypothetical protein
MCYEAVVALAEGDEATLAKSLIISLEDAAANWYKINQAMLTSQN